MEVKITFTGNFWDKIKKGEAQSKIEIERGLREAATHLYEKSIENAPASTGQLRQGMKQDINTMALTAEIYPSSQYAIFVHGPGGEGRTTPHAIPVREAAPGGSLYRWAKKKGMNPWAVRASIKKRGTKYQPWLEKTAKEEENKVVQFVDNALERIAKFLTD